MTPVDVLRAIGQPNARVGTRFRYCATQGRTATVTFTSAGRLVSVRAS